MTSNWQEYLKANEKAYVNDLVEFLKIPSISSLEENQNDVMDAADWVAERLLRAGIDHVKVYPTAGHPVVYGDWLHAADKPTILIYGHFDTQPVDPVNLWSHPPFEPFIKNDRIYARGASDDKGNMLAPILTIEAFLKSRNALPVNIKFFFEGQEEIGSPQLPEFIAANKEMLACDLVISADGGQWDEDQPALLTGLRGLCALQVDVFGAKSDVHSGVYGGAFLNPIQGLVQLLATLHGSDGRVTVKGFYDSVRSLEAEERAQIEQIPFDEAQYKKDLGIKALFGEAGYSIYERLWTRPTLELNGIWGGFQDSGTKTVIPREAHAKITCRLVPNQTPDDIAAAIHRHLDTHAPEGISVVVTQQSSKADPYRIPNDHPGNQAVREIHKRLYGKDPYYVQMGGTIPVCAIFKEYLNAYTVNFAFGLDDENVHAPDEFWRLESFEKARKAYGLLLEKLSKLERNPALYPENP